MKYLLIDIVCIFGIMGSCDAAFTGADENNHLLRIAGILGFALFAWRYQRNGIDEYKANLLRSRSDVPRDLP